MTPEKAMPINEQAEQFIIGSVLVRGAALFDEIVISADDFALQKHRVIWRRIADLVARGEAVDRVTVVDALISNNELESVDGLGYVADLDDQGGLIENIEAYVRSVKEKANLRRLAAVCQNGLNRALNGNEDSASIIASEIAALQNIETAGDPTWATPAEVIDSFPSRLQFLSPSAGGISTGIPLPWDGLQALTGGMQDRELIILAGRPSMGKSAAAQQMALHALINGYPTGYESLEMKKAALIRRLVVQLSGVDSWRMRHGRMSDVEKIEAENALKFVERLPLHIDDKQSNGRTAQAVVASIRQLQARHGIRLAIIDHMHLIDGPEKDERSKFNRIIDCFQRGASDLGIPFLVLAQLSRRCEDENREPGLIDLRETGKIEDNADLIMFVHRPEMYVRNRGKVELNGVAKMIVAKQRDGATGSFDMVFRHGQTRFDEGRPDHGTLQ